MTNSLLLVVTAGMVAQALFCTAILAVRSRETPASGLLAAVFVALCLAGGGPLVALFAPHLQPAFFELSVPAYLIMGPALCIWIEGMTAEAPWRIERRHLGHLLPAGLSLVLVLFDINVPDFAVTTPAAALGKQAYVVAVAGLWGVTLVAWIAQAVFLVRDLMRRLPAYRVRLSMLVSNTDHADLRGLEGVGAVIAVLWVGVLVFVILRNVLDIDILPEWLGAVLLLVLVWSLGLWGLNQRPGLQRVETGFEAPEGPATKYQKSGLGSEQTARIAAKLEAAMAQDRLYLDPNLSLPKLSRHIRVPANHISQALNTSIGLSFFDYVNRWRVQSATADVINGSKGVLDIAFDHGFNARSSFYRAFRKETGLTPTEYRLKG
ncbi:MULTISPECIES: AraC family transcriptional regulator [Asticcacaulis]|uniref:helix-turn-helix domain-containing protein n=1 Tax=Asticcacaulis TaxID=76890 RepID=UPI001AEA8E2E|nr:MULTISPECIES: helix-turn-helix transcriptional regulator [Asticcacaulis]MBP2158820.1 AraC-like DNA-binding protein [Asticcacaulis solisilvae]MDR6799866.1 AraC-like DNA-binding protein [Asticcacaulis sp. BE141]